MYFYITDLFSPNFIDEKNQDREFCLDISKVFNDKIGIKVH